MDTTPCFPHIGYKLLIRLRSGRVIHSEQCKNNRRVQVNMQIRIISCCFSCKNRACFTILLAASAETNEYSSVFNSPCSLMKLYQPYSDDAMPSCSLTFLLTIFSHQYHLKYLLQMHLYPVKIYRYPAFGNTLRIH